ncbi:MAG TPA: histidine kinase [Burkholderiaceae bacterium]|nr:histidine kinase [Burkholderiaceae bacterium]
MTQASRPFRSLWPRRRGLRQWLHGAFAAFLWCLLIGLVLAGVSGWRDFRLNMLYSLCIGMSCWALIDASFRGLAHVMRKGRPCPEDAEQEWPGLPWIALAVIVGSVGGFTIGQQLGDLISGQHTRSLWSAQWSHAAAMLTVTGVASLVATAFFYTRHRMAAAQIEAEQARRVAAETQLLLLQAQLEPHMLFNTLANLRVLIGLDAGRAQAMLDQLIAFLRATLESSRVGSHALRNEFARLQDYLSLMQVRMGDRLQARFELPAELASLQLPPLLLQPLVENAIKHGLEPQIEGGTLSVQARLQGEDCLLVVADSGRGQFLPAGPGGTAGTGFGLQQVRDRLQARYGEAAGLSLSYPPEGGCRIEIHIPRRLMSAPAPAVP